MIEHPSTKKVRNPWSDLCAVNGDPDGLMGAGTLAMAMQWGAPSSRLTPEARQLLDDYYAWADKETQIGVKSDGTSS